MRFLISYDASSDALRNKIVKILEQFGTRIQYSVFEFCLAKPLKTKLHHELNNCGLLFNEEISLIIIPICSDCEAKIERYNCEDYLGKKMIIL